jgi:hypothetical protein
LAVTVRLVGAIITGVSDFLPHEKSTIASTKKYCKEKIFIIIILTVK